MRLLFLFVDCLWSPVANSAGFSHTRTHAFSRRHTHTAHICFFSVVGEQYDSCLTRNAYWINRRKASTASTMYCVTFTQQFFSAHNSYCVHQASRTTHEYGRCAKSHTLCQGRYIYINAARLQTLHAFTLDLSFWKYLPEWWQWQNTKNAKSWNRPKQETNIYIESDTTGVSRMFWVADTVIIRPKAFT